MNTSMTINATAAWLLGLYIANAEDNGVDPVPSQGTTQNDIVKEYLSRGTYIFPPGPSRRLHRRHHRLHGPPRAAVEPDQRLQLPPPRGRGDAHPGAGLRPGHGHRRPRRGARTRARSTEDELPQVVGRISFFVNAGVRFVEETCKMRAFTAHVGPDLPRALRGDDPKLRRFRYGVQVNSLGLTEQQPENNVPRIVLETLGVTLSARRPGPGHPAAGLERGPRPAPALGPAVVAAHPADPGLRDRPARVRRHLRGLDGHRGQDRRARRRRPRPSSTTCWPSGAPSRPSTS